MPTKPISRSAVLVSFALALAAPAAAQSPTSPDSKNAPKQHHEMMSGMMKDMAQQMTAMAEEMGHAGVTADQEKQMGHQMDRMSGMMHRMSGMAMRPDMRDSDFQKQMGRMRGQMNDMMRNSSPSNAAKPSPQQGSGDSAADPHGHE